MARIHTASGPSNCDRSLPGDMRSFLRERGLDAGEFKALAAMDRLMRLNRGVHGVCGEEPSVELRPLRRP